MRVARSLQEAAEFGPTAVTIGNFDGVHAGHRQLLRGVIEAAREKALGAAVLTFDPHPVSVVAPERSSKLLTRHSERCALMAREGIEYVLILPFTPEVSYWTPEQFGERVLSQALHARVVVVGAAFRFGYNQAGDTVALAQLGARFGYETRVFDAVKRRGRIVSSSEIRRAVVAGKVELAARLLERPYALEGEVVRGQGIGSRKTVPTLNLQPPNEVLPGSGVYITCTRDLNQEGRSWRSITNVGTRPTFGGSDLSIETFLLDPLEEPSPERIRVEFLRRLRDERKFETPEALKAQILRDVSRAKTFFRRLPNPPSDV